MASLTERANEAIAEMNTALESALEANKAPELAALGVDALKTLKKHVNKSAAVAKKLTDLVRLKGDLPPAKKIVYDEDPGSDESEEEEEDEDEDSDFKAGDSEPEDPEPSLEAERDEDEEPKAKKPKTAAPEGQAESGDF